MRNLYCRQDCRALLSLTIHLNSEDTLLAGRPHRGFDAGLAHQVVVEGVLPVGQVHAAHLARETGVVPAQTAAQGDLLNTRRDILRRKLINNLTFPSFILFLQPWHLSSVSSSSLSSPSRSSLSRHSVAVWHNSDLNEEKVKTNKFS